MKKIIAILVTGLLFGSCAYAFDLKMLDARQKIFVLSQEIKDNVAKTKDPYAMQGMFNSCLSTVLQLDAYFHMVGIFDTIKKESLSGAAVDFLTAWLQQIQKTNQLNLDTLQALASSIEPTTKQYADRVRAMFNDLNSLIIEELNKISALKRSIAVTPAKKLPPKR